MNPRPSLHDPTIRTAFHVQPLSPLEIPVPTGAYQPLIENLAAVRRDQGTGVIAAFTAVSRGDGVTYVIESLAWELAKQTGEQTLLTTPDGMSSAAAARFGEAPIRSPLHPVRRLRSNEAVGRRWDDLARQDFDGLRRRFGFVLVDCPAMRGSGAFANSGQRGMSHVHQDFTSSVLPVCRLCDGVVLVVVSGVTQRRDLLYAQSALQVASANLLGLVLNKRVEAVPGVISKLLG